MLHLKHHIIHSGHDLMKHAEILTGGMALIPPPVSGTSHTLILLHQRHAAPLPTSEFRDGSIRSLASPEAATHKHMLDRITTGAAVRTDYL
jgi:hypothetical protein